MAIFEEEILKIKNFNCAKASSNPWLPLCIAGYYAFLSLIFEVVLWLIKAIFIWFAANPLPGGFRVN